MFEPPDALALMSRRKLPDQIPRPGHAIASRPSKFIFGVAAAASQCEAKNKTISVAYNRPKEIHSYDHMQIETNILAPPCCVD
jgi:hypothetical protein